MPRRTNRNTLLRSNTRRAQLDVIEEAATAVRRLILHTSRNKQPALLEVLGSLSNGTVAQRAAVARQVLGAYDVPARWVPVTHPNGTVAVGARSN